MLQEMTITNFLCFDENSYEVNFNKLNVIVGENNSGKSSLFHAINLIRDFTTRGGSSPNWNSSYYQLNNLKTATYGHDLNRRMSIDIKGQHHNMQFGWNVTKDIERPTFPNPTYRECVGGTTNQYPINHPNSQEMAKQIWYFSPKRNSIPFVDAVGNHGDQLQPILPTGNNISTYLLEQYTSRNPLYAEAEKWLMKFDPQISLLKSPLRGIETSIETTRNDGNISTDINLSMQGSGIQNIASMVCALIFSPKETTIIIEEPENFLHPRSIETMVDLFNYAVNELNKQVIITTHSFDLLTEYFSDLGLGTPRGKEHVKINPEYFKLLAIRKKLGPEKIVEKNLQNMGKFSDAKNFFKDLLG